MKTTKHLAILKRSSTNYEIKGIKSFSDWRSYSEIHQLVPEGFKVDGIISSNGTTGEIDNRNLFKHSMSLEQVKNIVELAEQQNIYYEVFPLGHSVLF